MKSLYFITSLLTANPTNESILLGFKFEYLPKEMLRMMCCLTVLFSGQLEACEAVQDRSTEAKSVRERWVRA